MTTERERVLSISLTHQEWEAFVSQCPQPVEWLRQQILAQIANPVPAAVEPSRTDRRDASLAAGA